MSQPTLVDTGVLVALLSRDDQHHNWAVEVVSHLPKPFFTCEAVLTETYFLLRRSPQSHQRIFTLLQRGAVVLGFELARELASVSALMTRYQTVPMSLADACLVRMAEQYTNSQVLTIDSDFEIYRKHRNQIIPTITPP